MLMFGHECSMKWVCCFHHNRAIMKPTSGLFFLPWRSLTTLRKDRTRTEAGRKADILPPGAVRLGLKNFHWGVDAFGLYELWSRFLDSFGGALDAQDNFVKSRAVGALTTMSHPALYADGTLWISFPTTLRGLRAVVEPL